MTQNTTTSLTRQPSYSVLPGKSALSAMHNKRWATRLEETTSW